MRIKLNAGELKVGMFVSDIDRPWLDTPFMFQGFRLDDAEQLAELRRYCSVVTVDRELSREGMFPAHLWPDRKELEEIVPTQTGAFAPTGGSEPAGERIGFMNRLRTMFGGRGEFKTLANAIKSVEPEFDYGRAPMPIHHDYIPETVALTYHRPTKTLEEEMEPARQIFSRSEEFTRQVFSDINNGKAISIEGLEEVMHNMVESMVRNPDALLWVAHLKQQDTETYAHDLQVAVYLVAFGRNLSLPTKLLDQLCMLGLLLDIGKTKLPRELLAKPGRLTPDEFALTKRHVEFGLDLLRDTPNLHGDVFEGIAQHHEREDGSGYPTGLGAGTISLFGRMAAIVDAFVAITNVRPYAEALSALETLRKLTQWSEGLFHKPLVEQFIQAVGVFPVGSLVELSTGEVAVVVRQNKVRRLQPRVLVICGPDKVPAVTFRVMELLYQPDHDSARVHIVRGLPAGAYGLDAREYYLS